MEKLKTLNKEKQKSNDLNKLIIADLSEQLDILINIREKISKKAKIHQISV